MGIRIPIIAIAVSMIFSCANATDIEWEDKAANGTFTSSDANAIKTAVNSKADLADLDGYLSEESDPVFAAWDFDYESLINRPDMSIVNERAEDPLPAEMATGEIVISIASEGLFYKSPTRFYTFTGSSVLLDAPVTPEPPEEPEAYTCSGTTYYVSNDGSDSANDGLTIGTPWATLAKVNTPGFQPGDCILFNRGDTWSAQLLIPNSGSVGNPILYGAYGTGNKPILDGTTATLSSGHGLIRGSTKSYITIADIRVQDVGIGRAAENTGIGFYAGSNIIVQDCEVSNTESSGIKMNVTSNVKVIGNDVSLTNCDSDSEQISLSSVNGFEVAYNVSHDTCPGATAGAGIDSKVGSKDGTIHHNEVYNINAANGIYVDAYSSDTYNIQVYANYIHDINDAGIMIGAEQGGALHDVTISHNIVTDCLRGGMAFHANGPTGNPVSDIKVYNNTFNRNGTNGTTSYGGVRIFDPLLTGVTFKNNIMSNAYNFQIGVDNVSASVVTADYNVIYGDNADIGGFVHISGTNTISTDPLFTGTDDHTLQAGSSALNTCDASVWAGTPNVLDYAGTAITDGTGTVIAPGGMNCGALE